MKRMAGLAAMLSGCAAGSTGLRAAPDFRLASLDGEVVAGGELGATQPVLLVFMTAW